MLSRSDDRLTQILDRLALTVALIIVIGLPVGHFLVAYKSVNEVAAAEADSKAQAITELISANPDLWKFQVSRLEGLLLRNPALGDDEAASLRDANDRLIVKMGEAPRAPVLRRSSPLYDSGRVVGRVEIERSIRPMLYGTAVIGFLGILLSALAYASLRILPLRALRRVTAELDREKNIWQFAVEGAGDGVWDWDLRTGEVRHSTRYLDMYGFSEDELQRPDNGWQKRLHPDDLPRVQAQLQACVEGKTGLYVGERRMRCKDGSWRWVLARSMVVSRAADGKPLRMIGTNTDVTERKRAEVALRENELRYRTLFDHATDGILLLDVRGNVVDVNVAFAALHGYRVDEMMHMNLRDLDTPQSLAAVPGRLERVLAGESIQFETQHYHKDSHLLSLEVSTSAITLDLKQYILAFHRDITERKRAEQLVRLEHSVTRCLADPDDAASGLKAVIRVVCETQSWERGSYWHADEAAGVLRFGEFWNAPGADFERYTESSRDVVFAPGVGLAGRVWQSGEPLWVADPGNDPRVLRKMLARESSMFVFPVFAERRTIGVFAFFSRQKREPDDRLLAAARMIGSQVGQFLQRKQAEQALHTSERTLRAVNERLQMLIQSSPLAIYTRDVNGLLTSWNPAAEEMYGWKAAEVLGRPLPSVPEEGRAESDAFRLRLLAGESFIKVTARRRRRDGSLIEIDAFLAPLRDVSGKVEGIITVAADVTERKQAEAARAEFEAHLRESQKMEAMGTLAAGIAHDFNNILAAILGNAMLAKKDMGAGATAGALVSLDEIDKAASRAKDLVQKILAFSRRQPQDLVIRPLRELVQEALGLLRATLPAGVEIAITLADAPLHVQCDGTQIHQVLMNLCTNAWHALEGRPGRIEIGLVEALIDAGQSGNFGGLASGRYARIRVSDNGCGMDAATQARIFEPFYTTKPVDKGTGLGLAVVHGIVKSHHGTIAVDSAPGKGTRVDVYLPVAPEGAEIERSALNVVPLGSGAGRHVLYVDDDEAMVFLVTRMLEHLGYRVSGYDNPHAALEAVRADPLDFDLIVTDFNMPGLSGLEVAQEMRGIRPELPVVITSGYVSEELTAGARAAGVRQVVYKPNTVDELCAIIRRLLDAPEPA